jgi:hypothetical protein
LCETLSLVDPEKERADLSSLETVFTLTLCRHVVWELAHQCANSAAFCHFDTVSGSDVTFAAPQRRQRRASAKGVATPTLCSHRPSAGVNQVGGKIY